MLNVQLELHLHGKVTRIEQLVSLFASLYRRQICRGLLEDPVVPAFPLLVAFLTATAYSSTKYKNMNDIS